MQSARIFNDAFQLKQELVDKKIVATSGGFEVLHIGHLRCIQESAQIAKNNNAVLVVIVNGDGFLMRKKGKSFMPHSERMEIISGLMGVNFVLGWDDGSQFVSGALEILKPNFFTKGGDRSSSEVVPEFEICQKIGCQVLFGVGGNEKVQSSTNLIQGISS